MFEEGTRQIIAKFEGNPAREVRLARNEEGYAVEFHIQFEGEEAEVRSFALTHEAMQHLVGMFMELEKEAYWNKIKASSKLFPQKYKGGIH